jgi:GH18 family chitinase
VVGYWPTWRTDTSKIQFTKLSHINYAFALPNDDGTLKPIENTQVLESLVEDGHANGVKVGLAVGGGANGDNGFASLAANGDTRSTFVDALMDVVEQYNLDSIDLDWEYPDQGEQAENFILLASDVSQALHAEGKLLTAAVTHSDWPGSFSQETMTHFDFLNIMAYDVPGDHHSTYEHAEEAFDHWLGAGLEKEKAVLGVPFYSNVEWVYAAYWKIIEEYPYAWQNDTTGGYAYNGISTIQHKTELAMDRGSGIMIWELSHDTTDETSLLSAIYNTINQ